MKLGEWSFFSIIWFKFLVIFLFIHFRNFSYFYYMLFCTDQFDKKQMCGPMKKMISPFALLTLKNDSAVIILILLVLATIFRPSKRCVTSTMHQNHLAYPLNTHIKESSFNTNVCSSTHYIIHVPYHIHTVHHHHKVPVYIKHHTHTHTHTGYHDYYDGHHGWHGWD